MARPREAVPMDTSPVAAPRVYDCDGCGATIPNEALASGEARIVSGRMLCATCRRTRRRDWRLPALAAALSVLAAGEILLYRRAGEGSRIAREGAGALREDLERRLGTLEGAVRDAGREASALRAELGEGRASRSEFLAVALERLAALHEAHEALAAEVQALARVLPGVVAAAPPSAPPPGGEATLPPAVPPEPGPPPAPADPRGTPRARWLLDRLGSENPRLRAHALRDVRDFGDRVCLLPEVVDLLDDPYGFVRREAAQAAESIGDVGAVRPLLAQVRVESEPAGRYLMLRALGILTGEPADWPALAPPEIEAILSRWAQQYPGP